MAKDYEIFEGKTLSDVFKDIYDNSKTNKQQLEVLMKEVVGFIKDGDRNRCSRVTNQKRRNRKLYQ